MVHLVCNGEHIYGNVYQLTVQKYCITNLPSVKRGKWYYEVQHEDGSDFQFLAAFNLIDSYFGVYPGRSSPSFYTWSNYVDSVAFLVDDQKIKITDLGLTSVDRSKRIGIGIDLETHIFYFRSGNNVRIIRFWTNISGYYSPYLFESNGENYYTDKIHAYFDKREFEYEIPFGYLPWGSQISTPKQTTKWLPRSAFFIFTLVK